MSAFPIPPKPPLPPPTLNALVAMALGLVVEDRSRWCGAHCIGAIAENGDFPVPKDPPGWHFHEEWRYYVPDPECPHDGCRSCGDWGRVKRYDSSWSATGPLIERFGISVSPFIHGGWIAVKPATEPEDYCERRARTPLLAVCNLILELYKNRRLAR